MINSRRVMLTGQVAGMEDRSDLNVLAGKLTGK